MTNKHAKAVKDGGAEEVRRALAASSQKSAPPSNNSEHHNISVDLLAKLRTTLARIRGLSLLF